MDYNDSIGTGPICQCPLFENGEPRCSFISSAKHKLAYTLARDMYQQSTRCHRSYLDSHDPLNIDFFHVRMCTDMDPNDFEVFAQVAYEINYRAAMESPGYDEDCLNQFASTGTNLFTDLQEPELL